MTSTTDQKFIKFRWFTSESEMRAFNFNEILRTLHYIGSRDSINLKTKIGNKSELAFHPQQEKIYQSEPQVPGSELNSFEA